MSSVACEHDVVEVSAANGIRIDSQFADLIPPLAGDERAELEASIVQHGGAREPLIVWYRNVRQRPTLIDGHHRYEICTRLGLPYSVRGIQFASAEHAKAWIERNQIGRRNLNRDSFAVLLGRLYNRLKRLPGGRPPKTGGPPQRTRERLAAEYGVDPRTVDRAGAFQTAAEKLGIENDIASGSLSVTYTQVVNAAKSLPRNATRAEAMAALRAHRGDKRDYGPRRRGQSWLLPEEPADCLKAIRFYARSFIERSPDSTDALRELLLNLLAEMERLAGERDE